MYVTKAVAPRRAVLARSALALVLYGALAGAFAQQDTRPVLPGDDFYAHANGAWTAATEIPADRGSWGAGSVVTEQTDERIRKLIEQAQQQKRTGDAGRVANYYRAFMDEAGIEVPFPQTDLRIRSLFGREGDEAIAAMLGQHLAKQADTGTPSSRPSQPSQNDAAAELLKPPEAPPERDRE